MEGKLKGQGGGGSRWGENEREIQRERVYTYTGREWAE